MFFTEGKYTRSTYFLLPLVFFPVEYFHEPFVNCFIRDEASEHYLQQEQRDLLDKYDEKLFILLQGPKTSELIRKLRTFNNYLCHYEIYDCTMVVVRLLPFYAEEYHKFLKGKYSKYGDKAKQVIKEFYTEYFEADGVRKRSLIYIALDAKQTDRNELSKLLDINLPPNAEVHGKPNMNQETFNISKIKQIVK